MELLKIGYIVGESFGGLSEYKADASNMYSKSPLELIQMGVVFQFRYDTENENLRVFSLRENKFLERSESLKSQGIKGKDVLIITDKDNAFIEGMAVSRGWDEEYTSSPKLNWKASLMAAIEEIPVAGKPIAALLKNWLKPE